MATYCAVRKMQGSKEFARLFPTVLCGDCPLFTPEPYLTRKSDGRCLRYGKCSESGQRLERCDHCVYGIYDPPDDPDDDTLHIGRHINATKIR